MALKVLPTLYHGHVNVALRVPLTLNCVHLNMALRVPLTLNYVHLNVALRVPQKVIHFHVNSNFLQTFYNTTIIDTFMLIYFLFFRFPTASQCACAFLGVSLRCCRQMARNVNGVIGTFVSRLRNFFSVITWQHNKQLQCFPMPLFPMKPTT